MELNSIETISIPKYEPIIPNSWGNSQVEKVELARGRVPPRSVKFFLLATDILGFFGILSLTFSLRTGISFGEAVSWQKYVGLFLLTLGPLYVFDLYKPDSHIWGLRAPIRFILAVIVSFVLVSSIGYFGVHQRRGLLGRGVLLGSYSLFAIWGALCRVMVVKWLRRQSQRLRWLVIGSQKYIAKFGEDLVRKDARGQFFVLLTDLGVAPSKGHPRLSIVGCLDQLDQWLKRSWSGVIIATGDDLKHDLVQKLMEVRLRGLSRIYDLSDFYEQNWMKVPVLYIQNSWLALSHGFDLIHNMIGLRFKRVVDIFCSLFFLAVFGPIGLLVALFTGLEDRGPVIYRQVRTGKGGKLFTIYKFRSMRVDAEANGAKWAAQGDSRVTRIGRLIRLTRIDELPQIWNVLKGDMSFIGPRPERPEFNELLEKQIPYYNLRHLVPPGITGWAQVLYPYGSSVEDAREKLEYDLYYIKNYSFMMDVAIVFKTIRVVLFGKGR